MTVFHAIVGEAIGLKPEEETHFSQFTDGMSNSILVAEVKRSEAVPWSKPTDVDIDLDNPAALMGNTHQGGFHVGFADGSIRFISSLVNPDTFKAMLTRDAGDVANLP